MKKHLYFLIVLFSCVLLAQAQTISIVSQTNSPCFSSCTGAVTFSISGAVGPFTVTGGCTTSTSTAFSGNTVTLTGLCPCPSYNFVFTQGFSIIGNKSVNISSPPPIFATTTKTNVCCFGMCNGAIDVFVTGGSAPYSYTLNSSLGAQPFAPPYTGLCPGNYTVDVMDNNGCFDSQTVTITQPAPFSLTSSVTPATCSTCCDGVVNSSGNGGTPGYTYTIYPGGTNNSSGTFTNLCTGMYSVCASDNGCCSICVGVTITSSTTTGIQVANGLIPQVHVYPNPTSGKIKIIYDESTSVQYELYDISGRLVKNGEISHEVSVLEIENGTYELRIIENKSIISRSKLVVSKN